MTCRRYNFHCPLGWGVIIPHNPFLPRHNADSLPYLLPPTQHFTRPSAVRPSVRFGAILGNDVYKISTCLHFSQIYRNKSTQSPSPHLHWVPPPHVDVISMVLWVCYIERHLWASFSAHAAHVILCPSDSAPPFTLRNFCSVQIEMDKTAEVESPDAQTCLAAFEMAFECRYGQLSAYLNRNLWTETR